MVGSVTWKVVYYIGYPQTVVRACIRVLFWQSLLHLMFGQFLLILKILSMEPLGPIFSTVLSPSISFIWTLCCSWCIPLFSHWRSSFSPFSVTCVHLNNPYLFALCFAEAHNSTFSWIVWLHYKARFHIGCAYFMGVTPAAGCGLTFRGANFG